MVLHAAGYPGDDAPVIAGDGWSALCSGGKSDADCRPIDDLLAALDRASLSAGAGLGPAVRHDGG